MKPFSRLGAAVLNLFRQGVSADKIAECIAVGAAVSLCPIPVLPTLVCAVIAVPRRLNMALIQIVNYLLLPAQWFLILPFIRLGEWIFRTDPLPLSARQVVSLWRASPTSFVRMTLLNFGGGVVAWLIVAPLLAAALYYGLRPILRRRLAERAEGVRC